MERRNIKVPFSNLKFENWQNLVLAAVFFFYLSQYGFMVLKGEFLLSYGGDFLAFWSAGKIADESGYGQIYDIESLRNVQFQEFVKMGLVGDTARSSFVPTPAPYFSFFLIPFQLISRVNSGSGYWIWIILNLAILIGYLIFFAKRMHPEHSSSPFSKKLCFLLLLSFPVIDNLILGQLEVFLVICAGEFLRQALKKRHLPAGLWLGGLLLKPQLLIVVIPMIIILRNWRLLVGFCISSGVILLFSITLSGFTGMQSLVNIWTGFNDGNAIVASQRMINWRMVAVNLNSILDTSAGWIIAAPGTLITLASIHFLIKRKTDVGTPQWVMIMLGLFSITLAVSWHSHCHMAMIMIPFLVYGSLTKQFPDKVVFVWVIISPAIFLFWDFVALGVLLMTGININGYKLMVMGFSGFFSNLFLLISVMNYGIRNKTIPINAKA